MKSLYIFLSLTLFFFWNNETAFAQKSNKEIIHKAIDKMNYEFAIALTKRIKEVDKTVNFEEEKNVEDTTFNNVAKLKPTTQAKSLDRIFSKKLLSDGVTGYIYDIDFIKKSSKYPTDDLPSTINSLDKIVSKILSRINDFGDKQSKFKLTSSQLSDLKLRLNKIKNSAVSSLNPNKEETILQADTTKKDSTIQSTAKEETIKNDSIKIIYYKINQEEEKKLTGTNEATEGEKPTYNFGLNIKKTDSIQIIIKENSSLNTTFFTTNKDSSLILEGKNNIYVIDLNLATIEESDYLMYIIFGIIAVSIIIFVMYKESQKKKEDTSEKTNTDPLSRNDVVKSTVVSTNQNTQNQEHQNILAQNQMKNQIEEEKQRLTTIQTNPNLSNEQKLKEARSKNVITEVANNSEIKKLMQEIEELSTNPKTQEKTEEPIEEITTQKTVTPPKNTKNYHEPLYISLSDINETGIKSERKKGMSNTIFMIRPYSEGEEAKKADLMLHSDIKDMAFESIFRSIEKLDYIIEYNTLDQNVKKITQEEKGELIKEGDVWKVEKRLKVKFS